MSQDITQYAQRNLPAAPEDLWGQPQNALGSYQPQNGQPQQSPLKKLNRLLRGRWLLAICLSAAGAVGGAAAGWKTQLPLYAGQTNIEVKPVIGSLSLVDKATPYFNQALKNEALRIPSDRVISEAMKRPEWLNAGGHKYSKDYVAVFLNNLTVNLVKDSSMIQITFQSEKPKLAAGGANAIMKAYIAIRDDDTGDARQGKMAEAQRNLEAAQQEKHKLEDQISELTKDFGAADLGPPLSKMMEEREKLNTDLIEQQLTLKNAQSVMPDAKGNRAIAPLTAEEIAQFDSEMHGLIDQLQQKKDLLDRSSTFYGPKNPVVAKAQLDYDNAQKQTSRIIWPSRISDT